MFSFSEESVLTTFNKRNEKHDYLIQVLQSILRHPSKYADDCNQ